MINERLVISATMAKNRSSIRVKGAGVFHFASSEFWIDGAIINCEKEFMERNLWLERSRAEQENCVLFSLSCVCVCVVWSIHAYMLVCASTKI